MLNKDKTLINICSLFFVLNFSYSLFWSISIPQITNFLLLAECIVFVYFVKIFDKKTAIVIFLAIFFALIILTNPLVAGDARLIWFFHAKRIFWENNYYAQLDGYAPWTHNDYPLLIPSIAASIAKYFGFWNQFLPRVSLIMVLIPVLLLISVLVSEVSLLLIMSSFLLICGDFLLNGYMDAILAIYYSACCLILLKSFNQDQIDRAFFIPFFLLVLNLLFIKNEGLLGGLILTVIYLLRDLKKNNCSSLLLLLPFIIYFFIWKIHLIDSYVSSYIFEEGNLNRFFDRISNIYELTHILFSVSKAIGLKTFLVFTFSLSLILYLDKKLVKEVIYALLFVVIYMFSIVVIYIITPLDLVWHLMTSSGRTFLSVKLCIMVISIYLIFDLSIPKATKNYFKLSK